MLMMISMPLALRSVWLFCFCGRARLMAEKMMNSESKATEMRPAMSRWREPSAPNRVSDEKTILLLDPALFLSKASGIRAKRRSNHHGCAKRYPVECVSISLSSIEWFLELREGRSCRGLAGLFPPFQSVIPVLLGDLGSARICD